MPDRRDLNDELNHLRDDRIHLKQGSEDVSIKKEHLEDAPRIDA
jgi:hypothetical protein